MTGKLTVKGVRTLKEPGRVGDGSGLWLQIRDADHKSWLFRYKLNGKARAMGLGPVEDVGLAEARDAARECRRLLREGIDPINHRRASLAAKAATGQRFKDVAEAFIATHESAWRNQVHRDQWRTSLETFVFPTIGETPVSDIDTEEILDVLQPIWTSLPETARRIRGRLEAVLNFAKTKKMRSTENPARWRGHLKNLLPAHQARQAHHNAMPYDDVPAFMADLCKQSSISALALRFLVLTATRRGETVGARWDEVDLDKATWVLPPARMKAYVEHRVALSSAAIDVLKAARRIGGESEYVFPSDRRSGPIDGTTLVHLLRRMKRDKDTSIHGLRSSFADWCAERTSYPREIREMALAHKVGTAVEQAYRRTDLLEKRARLMEDWGVFVTTVQPPADNVVPIRATTG